MTIYSTLCCGESALGQRTFGKVQISFALLESLVFTDWLATTKIVSNAKTWLKEMPKPQSKGNTFQLEQEGEAVKSVGDREKEREGKRKE